MLSPKSGEKHAVDWYFDLTSKHLTPLSRAIQLNPTFRFWPLAAVYR
ncbi:hypothetical protein CEV31_3192 [Brucella thiophenivorans]|uniref:Uncharacterized protein n=1 Tax=Brucella thiophenivorans TaxID=571255 RepID=A0A256FJB0_9HYPH|nr:hypothetical protein CEV31_3192 [Brucella thiophenivorans]